MNMEVDASEDKEEPIEGDPLMQTDPPENKEQEKEMEPCIRGSHAAGSI